MLLAKSFMGHVFQLMMRQRMDSSQKVMTVRMDYEPPKKPDVQSTDVEEIQ